MFLVLLLLFILVGWLFGLRVRGRHGIRGTPAAWRGPRGRTRDWWIVTLLAFATHWPLLRHALLLLRGDAILLGDAPSHAAIIRALAERGAPHGWIDVYDGGFPLGVNYPPLGWLLGAALARLGLPVPTAIQLLGLTPYVLAPIGVVLIARSAGARPIAALAGAVALAAISPYNAWLGTFETYLSLGLLSQATAVPFVLGIAWGTISRRATWALPLLGAGLASAHPQITVMAAIFATPLLVLATQRLRRRLMLAAAGCAIAGLALYGPGLALHKLPFAWTTLGDAWWFSGYRLDRLGRWLLDGELFDQLRDVPLVTSVWWLSVAVLLPFTRSRAPRAALASVAWSLVLCTAGRALLAAGDVGLGILTFLQPQRAFAMVPLAMTGAVVVAAEELASRGDALRALPALRDRGHHLVPALLGAGIAVVSALAPEVLVTRLTILARTYADWHEGRGDCGPVVAARAWTATLDRGRLTSVEDGGTTSECSKNMGVELMSPVALGVSSGAGAHVGIITAALTFIRPAELGSDARAEALGVRWVLHGTTHRPPAGFRSVHANAPFELSERIGGTDLVGLGCVKEVWRGSNRALRVALLEDLPTTAVALHPLRLVALEETGGPLERTILLPDGCDPGSASVVEVPRAPGAYEATVDTRHEVDVVIRASAFSTWTVRVDDVVTPWRTIAPGFVAVRVPAGHHRIVGVVAWPPFYAVGLGLASVALAVLAWRARRLAREQAPPVASVVPSKAR